MIYLCEQEVFVPFNIYIISHTWYKYPLNSYNTGFTVYNAVNDNELVGKD